MSVSIPKQIPSISQVNKAGDILRSETSTPEQISQAMKTLSLWRQAHGPALNTFQAMLRGRCKSQGFTDETSTVAQRMKRLPSIIGKLCRKKTRLSKMQDIAGLRVILPTVPDVRAFHEAMLACGAPKGAQFRKTVRQPASPRSPSWRMARGFQNSYGDSNVHRHL